MQSSDLKKKAQIREIVLSLIGIMALSFMIYSLGIAPKKKKLIEMNEHLTKLNAEAGALNTENQEIRKKIEEQKRAERILPTAQQPDQASSKNPRVQMIQGKLKPDYAEVADFLSAITKPDFRLNLDIQSLNYSDPKKEKGYISTRFTLVARGPFGMTVDFIEKLESVKALMGIDKINIDVDKDNARDVTLELVGAFYKLEDDHV